MRKTNKIARTLALVAALSGAGGCGSEAELGGVGSIESAASVAPEGGAEVGPVGPKQAVAGPEARARAARLLVQQVARALRDPAARSALYAGMAASPVKEGKLHLRRHLEGDGQDLRSAMAGSTAAAEPDALQLLGDAGPMEIYLPVAAHREGWKGGEDLIVATQLDEKEVPYGVDLSGAPVELSPKAPPATPVLARVPAESFQRDGAPLRRDLAARAGAQPQAAFTGLWINEVHLADADGYEGWLSGEPEFEMILQNATTRANIICAEEDNSIEPYAWNMDDDDYTRPFLLASDADLPLGVKVVVAMNEDDDTRCVQLSDKDYLKLAADLLASGANLFRAIQTRTATPEGVIQSLSKGFVALKSIIKGGDDFVGVIAGDGITSVGSTPKRLIIKDPQGTPVGWVVMQRKTDVAH